MLGLKDAGEDVMSADIELFAELEGDFFKPAGSYKPRAKGKAKAKGRAKAKAKAKTMSTALVPAETTVVRKAPRQKHERQHPGICGPWTTSSR